MLQRRKFAREPLMYIQQPKITVPNAPMQDSYRTTKTVIVEKTSKVEKKTPQTTRKRPIDNLTREFIRELKEPNIAKRNSTIDKASPVSSTSSDNPLQNEEKTEKKKFIDMSLEEKIDYFVHTPSHLPKMSCEVITEEKKFRGKIFDLQDNQVLMRVGRKTIKIEQEKIIDIRLLGF